MTMRPGGWDRAGGIDPAACDDSAATAENAAADALTRIRGGVYTPTPRAAEIDNLMIKDFMKTLAEVALNVASRMTSL